MHSKLCPNVDTWFCGPLGSTSSINQWSIYPFIHSFSNHSCTQDLLTEVKFPDRMTTLDFNSDNFGISMGDFTEIFLKPEEKGLYIAFNQLLTQLNMCKGWLPTSSSTLANWDAVLTCFFIDTSKNIVEYIRTLHHLLKPGGVWINLGPTLWHYEGSSNLKDTSIELDVDEIKSLCQRMGFQLDHSSVSLAWRFLIWWELWSSFETHPDYLVW